MSNAAQTELDSVVSLWRYPVKSVAWIERGIKPDGDDVLAADVSTLGWG